MTRKQQPVTRRAVIAATLAAGSTASAATATATAAEAGSAGGAAPAGAGGAGGAAGASNATIRRHDWTTAADWSAGTADGTAVRGGERPGVVVETPAGTVDFVDRHTGRTHTREYATWVSPNQQPDVPASELIGSWNAATPPGTWVRVEARVTYTDGSDSPWYTLAIWAADDVDIDRTTVNGQSDGKSAVDTDVLTISDRSAGPRMASYQLRLVLYREPGTETTPVVWRLSAMTSDVPDRFEVPASEPGVASGTELQVPRYSQNIHSGRYPEYNGGGQSWCSPTSSQMIIEYWGRTPTAEDLAWVNPDYDDPQVCHAARFTFDYEYQGCGNWPFNAAYAATYDSLQAVVTRLASLAEAEQLIAAGIPLITSKSFYAAELDGAGYGTAGHLMTVIGFTEDGDVIANDPASPSNDAVRRVYNRRQFENIWLRTRRHTESGAVASGSGGVCYLYFPVSLTPEQRTVLDSLGIG